jgi:ribosomal protein S27AE
MLITGYQMTQEHTCPKCGSDLWKALSLVHSEGLQIIHTTTSTSSAGVGVGTGGVGVGVGSGKGETSGSAQTVLSNRAAAPVEPSNSFRFLAGFFVILSIILLLPGWKLFQSMGAICGVIAFICLLVGELKEPEVKEAKAKYARDLEIWKNSRMCLRCGEFYHPTISPSLGEG